MSPARRVRTGVLVLLSLVPAALGLSGCVAAAAVVTTVVVVRMLTPYGYKLTIKAEEEPRALYNGLVGLLKQYPNIQILVENQPERAFDAQWTTADGVEEWVSLVVQPLPDETSQLVIAIGFGKKQKAKYKEWATERVGQMLDELGVEWKVAAATMDSDDAPMRLARAPWDDVAGSAR